MAYYVRLLPRKKKAPFWKIQFVSYKQEVLDAARNTNGKRTWDISKERWRSLGFHPGMTLAETRVRARQLNAQLVLMRQEERLRKSQNAERVFRNENDAVLPIEFVEEFELWFLRARDEKSPKARGPLRRKSLLWRAAQKMILALLIEPSDWFYRVNDIYDYFYGRQFSVDYMKSILSIANLWGFFISRKLGKPFLPVPMARGYERQRILEAFYRREKNRRRPSQPLTPEMLTQLPESLNRANFNWLFISVWFGLRPHEIDCLHNPRLWSVEKENSGRKVLRVFQTKIVALPPEDRWKPIPVLFSEQEFALKIIVDGNFKRPLSRTMSAYLGQGFHLYAGRKGFTDLMLSKGHSLENISIWMGHSTLSRTWRSYKDKRKFQL